MLALSKSSRLLLASVGEQVSLIVNWLHTIKDRFAHNVAQLFSHHSSTFEPPHDKTNKMAYAPSKDSDQPGRPPSLMSLRCLHEESLGPELPIECTVKMLIRLGGYPG